MSDIAIVGYGVVGKAMAALFDDAVLYDAAPGQPQDREAVNRCRCAFVCVPTPMSPDGSCDLSAVEEVVGWIECELIVLRSTVPPGTCESLTARFGRRIVFQPEYLGETAAHPFVDMRARPFVVLGGSVGDTTAVADLYARVYNAMVRFHFCDLRTAELAKYMENCFYAAKVIFCGEFFKIAEAMGVSYPLLREMWLADPRISPDHTFVYPENLGFSGKCLPKDLAAVIAASTAAGYEPNFLKSVQRANAEFRDEKA